jgi:hypothetical protein
MLRPLDPKGKLASLLDGWGREVGWDYFRLDGAVSKGSILEPVLNFLQK